MNGDRPARLDRFVAAAPTVAGWASLMLGGALLGAPGLGAATGMGEDRRLIRAAGVADLAIGVGLLRSRDPARWMLARLLGNVAIGALCARTIASDSPQRACATGLLGLLVGLSVMDGVVAWRLR